VYKLAKFLIAYGAKQEREKLKADLFYYLGWQPERRIDEEAGMTESEEHFKKRLDGWFEARQMINDFFREVEQSRQQKR
jgi:hypothetical protein